MKTNIILACSMLFACTASHAMEHAFFASQEKTKKNYHSLQTNDFTIVPTINTIQDIPRLSLKKINSYFHQLSQIRQQEISMLKNEHGKAIEESLTFNLATLKEHKIILKILSFMMDEDETSVKLFYKTPLWYSQRRYYHAKETLQKTPLTQHPAALLFRLPNHKQKEIIGIAVQTLISRLTNNVVITIDQEQEHLIKSYDSEIQKAFFANEDIRIITNRARQQIKCDIGLPAAGGGIIGLVGACIVYAAIAFSGGYPPYPPIYLLYASSFPCALMGAIGGSIYHTYTTEQKAPKIEI